MRNKNKNIMLDLEKITLNVREIALRAGAFLRNERSGFDPVSYTHLTLPTILRV